MPTPRHMPVRSTVLKRIVIMTTFASFSPDYSLVNVVADQLRMFADHGYPTSLVVQEDFPDNISVPHGIELLKLMPVMSLHDYHIGEQPRSEFAAQVAMVAAKLRPILADVDIVITHDLMFLGWYLPHNAALRQLATEYPSVRWLHWVHSAPSSRPVQLAYPHNLRFSLPPHSKLVYLNNHDVMRLARMYATDVNSVRVVYNTKDPEVFFDWLPLVQKIQDQHPLLSADVVVVYPFSTPRWEGKNVKKLIWLVAKIKALGQSVCLILINAHCNAPQEKQTVRDLLTFAFEKGLASCDICFTSMLGGEWEYSVPNEAVRQLFQLSNVFVLPSVSECCSLILLEAAICKNLLVLNGDVASMREFGGDKALYPRFGNVDNQVVCADEDAYWTDWAKIVLGALNQERSLVSFRSILQRHNPDWIFYHQLEPLLYEPWD